MIEDVNKNVQDSISTHTEAENFENNCENIVQLKNIDENTIQKNNEETTLNVNENVQEINGTDKEKPKSAVQEKIGTCNKITQLEKNIEPKQETNETQNKQIANNYNSQNTKPCKVQELNNIDKTAKIKNSKCLSETNLIEDSTTVARFSPKWKQFTAALAPIILICGAGLSSGYSATLLPQLKEEQNVIVENKHSPSWIASIAALPMGPCCFIGSWLMEKFGRRYALRLLGIPLFVGWVFISCAQNLSMMLGGRFLNGLSIGLLAPIMSVFISETSSPGLRGMFLAFLSLSFAVGIFTSHLLGSILSWQCTAVICAFFPLSSSLLLTFIPESPIWLFSKGKSEDAIKSFLWLRGYDDNAKKELQALLSRYKSIEQVSTPWNDKFKYLLAPELFKPLLIMIVINLTCQFCGIHTITFYSVDIIEKAIGEGIDRHLAMLTIDSLRVITTIVTCYTSRKCSRRALCISSGILTTLSLLSLSVFLNVYDGYIPTRLSFLPLCFLSAYVIAINIGLMPLPWIIVGEIFPAKVRSLGAGIASFIGYMSLFINIKLAPTMMSELGQVVTFLYFMALFHVLELVYYLLYCQKQRTKVY